MNRQPLFSLLLSVATATAIGCGGAATEPAAPGQESASTELSAAPAPDAGEAASKPKPAPNKYDVSTDEKLLAALAELGRPAKREYICIQRPSDFPEVVVVRDFLHDAGCESPSWFVDGVHHPQLRHATGALMKLRYRGSEAERVALLMKWTDTFEPFVAEAPREVAAKFKAFHPPEHQVGGNQVTVRGWVREPVGMRPTMIFHRRAVTYNLETGEFVDSATLAYYDGYATDEARAESAPAEAAPPAELSRKSSKKARKGSKPKPGLPKQYKVKTDKQIYEAATDFTGSKFDGYNESFHRGKAFPNAILVASLVHDRGYRAVVLFVDGYAYKFNDDGQSAASARMLEKRYKRLKTDAEREKLLGDWTEFLLTYAGGGVVSSSRKIERDDKHVKVTFEIQGTVGMRGKRPNYDVTFTYDAKTAELY